MPPQKPFSTVKEFIEAGRAAGHDALHIANDPEALDALERAKKARAAQLEEPSDGSGMDQLHSVQPVTYDGDYLREWIARKIIGTKNIERDERCFATEDMAHLWVGLLQEIRGEICGLIRKLGGEADICWSENYTIPFLLGYIHYLATGQW